MVEEPHTHPVKPTLGSNQTSPEAKALVEALQNILRNEEGWFIAEEHISRIRETIEEKYRRILAEEQAKSAGQVPGRVRSPVASRRRAHEKGRSKVR